MALTPYPPLKSFVESLKQNTDSLRTEPYIQFEFYCFVIRIASSPLQAMSITDKALVFESLHHVLLIIKDCMKYYTSVDEYTNDPRIKFWAGDMPDPTQPEPIEKSTLENNMVDMLRTYGLVLDTQQKDRLIQISREIKFQSLLVYLNELNEDFSECLNVFLTSPAIVKNLFSWSTRVFNRYGALETNQVVKLRATILSRVSDIVKADSTKATDLIDKWLDGQQLEVVERLKDDPKL